jgi:hypothetical protein
VTQLVDVAKADGLTVYVREAFHGVGC